MKFKLDQSFIEIKGKLVQSKIDKSKWKIEDEIFTVCPRSNPWVVRNMKKFRLKNQTVVVRFNSKRVLLSVRVL